jgi:putative membrane protein
MHMNSKRKRMYAIVTVAAAVATSPAWAGANDGPASDARIAAIVLSAEREEQHAADAEKLKFGTPLVWELAQRISVDDGAIDREFRALAGENDRTRKTSAAKDRFASLSGHDLEKAYVDGEVASHRQMLAELDRHLIPSATSEQMRQRLRELRAVLAAQLEHAEYVQNLITAPVSADPP